MAQIFVFILALAALSGVALGAVHNVGGHAGWMHMDVKYNQWASTKDFHAGDSLLFRYDSRYDDVRLVSHEDFLSCDGDSPIAVFTTGSDTVALPSPGHYYFICGGSSHCQHGHKVDVLVKPGPMANASMDLASEPIGSAPAMDPSSEPTGSLLAAVENI